MSASEALAASALEQYNRKDYDGAYESLQALQRRSSKQDPKINHNVALLLYLRDSEREPEKFLEALREIQAQMETKEEASDPDEDFDIDKSVVIYNRAVIYFQMKQYSTAFELLDSLFEHIEPIQEHLVLCICMLLLETCLVLANCTKAEAVLQYMEKLSAASSAASSAPSAGGSGAIIPNSVAGPPPTTNSGGRARAATESDAGDSTPAEEFNTSIRAEDLVSLVHQYRGRVQLVRQSTKTAKREIKTVMALPEPTVTAVFLKANLEYLRHNYGKAYRLLNTVPIPTPAPSSAHAPSSHHVDGSAALHDNPHVVATAFWNDLGVVHHRTGRHHLAQLYFSRALQQNRASGSQGTGSPSTPNLPGFSVDKRYEILYNAGLSLLFTGKPEAAFRSLRESARLLYKDPRVWLRLAECCIAAHGRRAQAQARAQRSDVAPRIVGTGPRRRVVLPTRTLESEDASPGDGGGGDGGSTMRYAAKCLRNAAALVAASTRDQEPAAASAAEGKRAAVAASAGLAPLPAPSIPVADRELQYAIMIKRCYVALALHNPVLALAVAERLLQEDCPPTTAFLAHMYAAEALCLLRRPAEATQHLAPAILGQLDTTPVGAASAVKPPYSALTYTDNVDVVTASRTAFYVNLAATFILQDNLPDAHQAIRQAVTIAPSAPPVVLVSAYLHLRAGAVPVALETLKKHRAQLLAP